MAYARKMAIRSHPSLARLACCLPGLAGRMLALPTVNARWVHGKAPQPGQLVLAQVAESRKQHQRPVSRLDRVGQAVDLGHAEHRVARTALFGPTMTACGGSTWRHPDGPMWPRFKQAATRRSWPGVGPDLADMRMLWIKLGPLQAVRVEPGQAVLTNLARVLPDPLVPHGGIEDRAQKPVCLSHGHRSRR